ncbi:MAG: aminoglycoside 6'-N-acetyltransferase [candidate division KSB1 bacterium]
MLILPIQPNDAVAWERMRQALWPSSTSEHAAEIAAFFSERENAAVEALIALDDAGKPLGFVELSIRNYAEGCSTKRVAYLEGWYVEPHARRQGVGAALVKAAEAWGRNQRCSEFASDTEWHNEISATVHRALGFVETDRIICFKKDL